LIDRQGRFLYRRAGPVKTDYFPFPCVRGENLWTIFEVPMFGNANIMIN
jgi:hypothetical protein